MQYVLKHNNTRRYLHYYAFETVTLTWDAEEARHFRSYLDGKDFLEVIDRDDFEVVGNINIDDIF